MAALTPRTPITSARKLFPRNASSDSDSDNSLGHMSPLSSPDRYSSPPCTPERLRASPRDNATERSPRTPIRTSPRNVHFDSLKVPSNMTSLSSLFLHRDVKRLRKHVDLNNTIELDKSFPKTMDAENENTPPKLPKNTAIPQTPSQKKVTKFGVVEESPDTPSVNKSPVSQPKGTAGNMKKATMINSGDEPSIPASMFYGKPSLTRELFPAPEPGNNTNVTKQSSLGAITKLYKRYSSIDSLHSISSRRSTRGNVRRKSRRMVGEINAGVYHKLRRPKPKKLSFNIAAAYKIPKVIPRSKAVAYLKSAGLPEDLSWLGQQVAQDTGSTPAALETPQKQQEGQGRKRKLPDPPTPPPDPAKKFFKTNRTIHKTKTVTFDGNIKLRVSEGKFSLNKPENPLKFRTRKVLKFKTTGGAKSDPLFESFDDEKLEQVNSSVRQLLENLDDESVAAQNDLGSALAAGGVVIASLPVENIHPHTGSVQMETSDEVVPGTPQKEQVVTEYVVGANDEIASPGLSFITSSLAISEDNSGSRIEVGSGKSLVTSGVEIVVNTPTESFKSGQQEKLNNPSESSASKKTNSVGKDSVPTSPTLKPSRIECPNAPQKENSGKKYFPLFYKSPERVKAALSDMTNKKTPPSGRRLPWRFNREDQHQYQIDAGQKRLGATQCSECGLVYSEGDMDDELAHLNYHNSTEALKFTGWKQERVVATHGSGRVVVVHPGDPKSWWKKVNDVVEVVDKDLGYADGGSGLNIQGSKVYLYVEGKSVVGCLVAQPITTAYRLQVTNGLDTCSQESYLVKCGVSRLWVVVSHRRRKIATKLVDCMRTNFMYGYILGAEEFAFSVPTVSGKEFGTSYTKNRNFLVYM